MKSLPPSVLRDTDWLVMENNDVRTVVDENGTPNYLDNITYLDLRNNTIKDLADVFWDRLQNVSIRLIWLNLADNNLARIPRRIQEARSLQKLWLGGNPVHCSCDMTWMIRWLENFTTPSGEKIVVDYREVTCHSGSMKGRAIYTLNEIDMGCYPNTWVSWQKAVVGAAFATLAVIIVILVYVVMRQSTRKENVGFQTLRNELDPGNVDDEENVERND